MYERTTHAIAETLRLFDEGNNEKATLAAQKLVREHPEVYEVCLEMAREAAVRGLVGIARSFIDAAETLFPHEFLHLAISAEIELIVGCSEVSLDLRSTVERRKQVLHLVTFAEQCLLEEKFEQALQAYEYASAADSKNPRIWQKIGTLRKELELHEEAATAWLNAHRLASLVPMPLIGLARALFASGNETGGLQAFRQGLMRAARSCPLALHRISACKPKKNRYESIGTWCDGVKGNLREIEAEQIVEVRKIPILNDVPIASSKKRSRSKEFLARRSEPKRANIDRHIGESNQSFQESAPRLWLAELKNVDVVGVEAVLLSNDVHIVSEPSFHPKCNQDGAIAQTGLVNGDQTVLMLPKERVVELPNAVLFGGRSCANYFHWIAEYLPRIALLQKNRRYDHLPLLLPEDLPKQVHESLDVLDIEGRERITLRRDSWIRVSNLLVMSSSAHLSDDRRDRQSRLMVHPWAVGVLRELFDVPKRLQVASGRRVFMRRFTEVDSRRLVNEEEIVEIFEPYGVESIDTRNMSFLEQIELFSECEVVVGTAGAAFANLMFTPGGCRALCLASRSAGVPYVFDSIARVSDQHLACLHGEPIRDQHASEGAHYSFWIDPDVAKPAVASFFSPAKPGPKT